MDCELVDRARTGDQEAFAAIVDATFDRSYEIARRILGESHAALDATQQAQLSIWQDLPKLRDVARFDAWSRRILVRACYAEAAKARRARPGLTSDIPEQGAPSVEMASVVDRDQVERAFAEIKVEQRVILVLRFYLDQQVDEIAETLDIPLGTAKSRLHHALEAMRAAVEADERRTTAPTHGDHNGYARYDAGPVTR